VVLRRFGLKKLIEGRFLGPFGVRDIVVIHGRFQQGREYIRNALHLHVEVEEQQDRGHFAPVIRSRGAIIAAQELGILVDVTVEARRGGLGLTAPFGRSMQDDVHRPQWGVKEALSPGHAGRMRFERK
jgi:hypothetical protein